MVCDYSYIGKILTNANSVGKTDAIDQPNDNNSDVHMSGENDNQTSPSVDKLDRAPSGPLAESVAGLLLAGGEGSRFDDVEHKLVVNFRGRPLAAWALAAALEAKRSGELAAVYVVTGAVSIRPVLEWIADKTLDESGEPNEPTRRHDAERNTLDGDSTLAEAIGVTIVVNDRWAHGQATSLAAGVAQAAADGHAAVVVGLADQPFVEADVWRAIAGADSPIAVASFDGKRRPPVKLHSRIWSLLPRAGDEGARSLLRLRPDLVSEVPCIGNPIDIDTMEDLREWS